jgi:hypothetical protein
MAAGEQILKRRNLLVMILLIIVTLGIYYPVWFLRRRTALNRLDSPRKLTLWPFLVCLAFFVMQFILGFATGAAPLEETIGSGGSLLLSVIQLGVGVLMLVQCFGIKDILEDHLAGPGDQVSSALLSGRVELSGVMTFLFTIFYLQHVINRDIVAPRAAAANESSGAS